MVGESLGSVKACSVALIAETSRPVQCAAFASGSGTAGGTARTPALLRTLTALPP
jgi:hypothetical protein